MPSRLPNLYGPPDKPTTCREYAAHHRWCERNHYVPWSEYIAAAPGRRAGRPATLPESWCESKKSAWRKAKSRGETRIGIWSRKYDEKQKEAAQAMAQRNAEKFRRLGLVK